MATKKNKKKFEDILHSQEMEKARQEAGVTLTNKELEFLVKLVKACD